MPTGTKEDPWLLETAAQLSTALRTQTWTGYYRLTGDITLTITDTGLSGSTAENYRSKVIDGNGYRLSISSSTLSSGSSLIAGVTFINCFISISLGYGLQYSNSRPFTNCFFTDCLINFNVSGAYTTTFARNVAGFISLEPKEFRRLVVLPNGYISANTNFDSADTLAETSLFHVYKFTSTVGTWYTRVTSAPTLALLDGLASGGFTAAGWFNDTAYGVSGIARPFFADVINLEVTTLVDGEPAARELMYEISGLSYLLGVSDASGFFSTNLRVKRFTTLRIVAAESYALDRLQNGNYVSAGKFYLPPSDNGRKYQASASGQINSLGAVTFGAGPVVVDGITFTPAPVYQEMASPRLTLQSGGPHQFITLDTADMGGGGGGGPVIEGDPAYLDGLVEEQHPILGTVRPLANAEVAVFELRPDGSYAAMGRALSNLLGEFRVETEVYGGGDVFCFALDFPGTTWTASAELSIGMRVRPTVNNGYVYEVVSAGVSGATEPAWWADEGDGTEGFIGTARAKARPYYQPVGDGPRKMTFT